MQSQLTRLCLVLFGRQLLTCQLHTSSYRSHLPSASTGIYARGQLSTDWTAAWGRLTLSRRETRSTARSDSAAAWICCQRAGVRPGSPWFNESVCRRRWSWCYCSLDFTIRPCGQTDPGEKMQSIMFPDLAASAWPAVSYCFKGLSDVGSNRVVVGCGGCG